MIALWNKLGGVEKALCLLVPLDFVLTLFPGAAGTGAIVTVAVLVLAAIALAGRRRQKS